MDRQGCLSFVDLEPHARTPEGCRDQSSTGWEVPGYNLHIMMVVLGCVIGVTAVIAIVRVLRVQRTLKENRMMRNYLRRIASDSNSL
jgi:hypothetical protein